MLEMKALELSDLEHLRRPLSTTQLHRDLYSDALNQHGGHVRWWGTPPLSGVWNIYNVSYKAMPNG